MSEALCGPSNPLANLRKHTAADRALQQDRFSSHASPAESFRSGHGAQPGLIDAEFNSFVSGHNPFANQSFLPQTPQHGFGPFPQPSFGQPQAIPDWAADFQRLQVGSRPSTQINAFPAAAHRDQRALDEQRNRQMNAFQIPETMSAPMPMNGHANQIPQDQWTRSFEAQAQHGYHNTSGSYIHPVTEPSLQDFQMQLMLMEQENKRRMLMPRQGAEQQAMSGASEQTIVPHDADSAAFEREFAAHDEDLSLNRYNSALSDKLNSDSLVDDGSTAQDIQDRIAELYSGYRDERDADMENPQSALEMDVSDPREAEMTPQERQKRDDDLADTAGELLNRVSDNTSRKFQESTFLALMRQLRDGEVKVDGDKMVDADTKVDVNEENVGTAYT